MKNKWLIWLVLLLLIMNVSAIITMLYHQKSEKTSGKFQAISVKDSVSSVQYSGRWFRDELQLSRDQMAMFSDFNPPFRHKVRSINIELLEKRREMLDELTAENSDTLRLNILSDSIGMLHAGLKKATYEYYLEFKKICTPEQQEKLKEIFGTMFEGEIPAGGPGQGMHRGRRYGMQWRNNQVNN